MIDLYTSFSAIERNYGPITPGEFWFAFLTALLIFVLIGWVGPHLEKKNRERQQKKEREKTHTDHKIEDK